MLCPPARRRDKKKKARFYIYTDVTHTHLLRNILSNYWCGMHLTCTNNSVKLTGMFGRFEVRNLSEVFFLRPCLKVLQVLMQLKIQIAKTVQNRKPVCWKRLGGSWVSHVPYPRLKQVRGVDQTPYQSWHSPLRWATSYAHEVAPCTD